LNIKNKNKQKHKQQIWWWWRTETIHQIIKNN